MTGLRQRGAALLAAMLTVTLVASFAAAALWQQWRAVEVETAERARVQAGWILLGALDWSRLILVEDGRASGTDHLDEPWAVPLEEARLSTFLAAEKNTVQVDDASVDTTDAFLSGQIVDLQARLNLRNLLPSEAQSKVAKRQFERLFERLGLSPAELTLLVEGLRRAQQGSEQDAPLLPASAEQLGWLGLSPTTVALLAPHVAMLPKAMPVNVNTASVDVLWAAIDGLDQAGAMKLVQARGARYFRSIDEVKQALGNDINLPDGNVLSVGSSFFEVRGRLRLGSTTVEERSQVERYMGQVYVLWRQRSALPPPAQLNAQMGPDSRPSPVKSLSVLP